MKHIVSLLLVSAVSTASANLHSRNGGTKCVDIPGGPYYNSCAGCKLEHVRAVGHCLLVCKSCMGKGFLVSQTAANTDPHAGLEANQRSSAGQILGWGDQFSIDPTDCSFNLVDNVDGKLVCLEDGQTALLADGQTEISVAAQKILKRKKDAPENPARSFSIDDDFTKYCVGIAVACIAVLLLFRSRPRKSCPLPSFSRKAETAPAATTAAETAVVSPAKKPAKKQADVTGWHVTSPLQPGQSLL